MYILIVSIRLIIIHCNTRWILVHFFFLIKMDKTVENGFKCGMCPRRLASKYSLERHIRLKHKSTSPETKKQKLEIAEFRQEINNNRGRLKHPKLDVKQASDPESDN